MSTRSLIMIKNNDVEKYSKDKVWASGTYHHHDGNPSSMGKFLMYEFQEKGWSWLRGVVEHSWSSLPYNQCYCCGTMKDGRREPFEERNNLTEANGWSDIEWIYLFSQDRDGTYIDIIYGSDVNKPPYLIINLTSEKNVDKVATYFDDLNMHVLGF